MGVPLHDAQRAPTARLPAGMRRQLGYWRKALAHAPPRFDLVCDRPRPASPIRAGSEETFLVSPSLIAALERLAVAQNASLPIVMLAAFTALLHRQSGEEDIVIGGVADLRHHPAQHDVPDNFARIVALRARPSPELPFDAHLAQVRTMAAGAFDHAEIAFDDIVRALDIPTTANGHPLFSILFSIEQPVSPASAQWDRMDMIVDGAGFDLHLALEARPDGIAARFRYSAALFDRATIRRMGDQWLTMLDGIVATPSAALGILPLMTSDEARRIAGWNATGRAWPEQTLIEMIGAQAHRTPDAAVDITSLQPG